MTGYAAPIQRLIQELGRLPGIGEKTATRLAMFILRWSSEEAKRLAASIIDVKEKIRFCSSCFNLAEGELCDICADPARDRERICVVEDPDSLTAIEESGSFRGTYHVLHGALAPLDGIGPDQIRVRELAERLERGGIREIIIATNPSVQGEATALLIMRILKDKDIELTRIALGVPVGGDLRYTDKMTLAKAMEFRRSM
jgi:recombination protein RecR